MGSSASFIILKKIQFQILYNSFIIKWQETLSNDVMQVPQKKIPKDKQVT